MTTLSDQLTEFVPWALGARLILEGEPQEPAQFSTTLEQAVRKFWETDWELQSTATLLVERKIALDGQPLRSAFYGDEIDAFARLLIH